MIQEWKNLGVQFKDEYFTRYINVIDNDDFIKKFRI